MQGVGGEVLVVFLFPLIALVSLAIYYRSDIREFIAAQSNDVVRIEQNQQQRQRRRNHDNDHVCSICLSQPKKYEVSSTCSHSFCGECILSLYQHNSQQIKCPLCRQNITLLFKLFESNQEARQIQTGIISYNSVFDDSNRSLGRRIAQLPYTLKRLWKSFFSLAFLAFLLRNLQLTRWALICIVYLVSPFDLLPQQILGPIGYIDDLLFILFVIVFVLTIAAVQYYRNQNN